MGTGKRGWEGSEGARGGSDGDWQGRRGKREKRRGVEGGLERRKRGYCVGNILHANSGERINW